MAGFSAPPAVFLSPRSGGPSQKDQVPGRRQEPPLRRMGKGERWHGKSTPQDPELAETHRLKPLHRLQRILCCSSSYARTRGRLWAIPARVALRRSSPASVDSHIVRLPLLCAVAASRIPVCCIPPVLFCQLRAASKLCQNLTPSDHSDYTACTMQPVASPTLMDRSYAEVKSAAAGAAARVLR